MALTKVQTALTNLGVINVLDYGATGDGVTDDSVAIQAGIAAVAALGGGSLYFPPGDYYCPNTGGAALVVTSSIRLYGAGMYRSVIKFDDSAGASRRDCLTCTSGAYDIEMENLGIQGDFGTVDWTQRSHLVEFITTGNVTVDKCRFSYSRYMSLVISTAHKVLVTNCEFYRGAADGCRATASDNVMVSNNFFESINDDAIAIHSRDDSGSPSTVGIVVSNNRLVDSQGITCLGAKHAVIDGNSITRGHTRGITVGIGENPPGLEGSTAQLGISITNNVITDMMRGYEFSAASGGSCTYIRVHSGVPTIKPGSGYVGQAYTPTPEIVSPYPYFYTNDTDGTAPNIGTWFLRISGNTCIRTLGVTANYSDYGFGTRYGRSGPVDPAVVASTLGSGCPMVSIDSHVDNCMISDNIMYGAMQDALVMNGPNTTAWLGAQNLSISGNHIANVVTRAMYINCEGSADIRGNYINCDPLHVHPNRTSPLDGTWDAGWGNSIGIHVAGNNVTVHDNSFRNLGNVFTGTTPDDQDWSGNVYYCDLVTNGSYNVGNVGIGYIGAGYARLGGTCVIEDGDPSSANYGKIKNIMICAGTGIPTGTQKYLQGHVIRRHTPTVVASGTSDYVIIGWVRLTTGTGHVLNTDWAEMRILTGT